MFIVKNGFSLVELSIVLVILGLLTGGILAGQNLIRAAEIRSISTDMQRYSTAVYTFRDKYFALPGDMRNAVDFWGAADGSTGETAACKTTASTGTETCNGDGDGLIENNPTASQEWYRGWQHMANAGLIEGSYTGVSGPDHANVHTFYGVNSPKSKVGQAGFVYRKGHGPSQALVDARLENVLIFGVSGAASADGDLGIISGEEGWNVDTKMDDGLPGQGQVTTFRNDYRADCSTTDDPATAAYDLQSTVTGDTACSLIFHTRF